MSEILLFHHGLGLTDGVHWFADRLTDAGHTVHTPDLFAARTFTTIEDGVAHAEQDVGVNGILQRADEAASAHPEASAFLGICLGAMPAYRLAQTRPGARACVAISAALPVDHFAPRWPGPVAWGLAGDVAELYEYPGDQHLFTEHGHPDFDPQATDLVLARTLQILERVSG